MGTSFGLSRLEGFLDLTPVRVVKLIEFTIWVAISVTSFEFWEEFDIISVNCGIMLTGKRFAIIVDDESLKVFGDVEGW